MTPIKLLYLQQVKIQVTRFNQISPDEISKITHPLNCNKFLQK